MRWIKLIQEMRDTHKDNELNKAFVQGLTLTLECIVGRKNPNNIRYTQYPDWFSLSLDAWAKIGSAAIEAFRGKGAA